MMLDRLFVYGTLMRGFDHPVARLLRQAADFIGEARCRGRLYRVKHYPGLVLSDDADDIVFGEVYRLRQRAELLREFDIYEACGEGLPSRPNMSGRCCRSRWATARSAKPGPTSTTGRSRTCRGSRPGGLWRSRAGRVRDAAQPPEGTWRCENLAPCGY